jgi:hypothetical protein
LTILLFPQIPHPGLPPGIRTCRAAPRRRPCLAFRQVIPPAQCCL